MTDDSGCTGSMAQRSSPSTTGSSRTSARGRSGSIGWISCWTNSRRRRKQMTATRSSAAKVTLPTDDEILVTREFDAPRRLVYQAWTTADLVKRWWSGQRGQVTIAEIDLR